VVRLAAQQRADAIELSVGETERAVERLFCDLRQTIECSRAVGGASAGRALRAASTA
jgi:hypothetical protein